MAKHIETGLDGEKLAAEYLINNGYQLLYKNWRHKHWEVDIIATRNNMLHFIEVKTRRGTHFGHPEENMSRKKIKNLLDAAEEFTYQFPQYSKFQLDVLAITHLNGKPTEYFLIEDVYL